MTRKLNRNYSLSVVAPFIAILTLLIAAAVLAQMSGAGQTSGKANAVLTPAGVSAPAPEEVRLTPSMNGVGRFPVGRSQTKRHSARPMGSNPLFLPAVTYGSGGSNPYSIVVADVNRDGRPDLVVANYCGVGCVGDGSVSVLLGNGDGTFQPAVAYDSGGPDTYSVAVADVNGDGKPDIVVANSGNNTVGVLLGNGDGTFRPAVTYPSSAAGSGATCPDAVTIADVNGDGRPDLIVTNYCSENYLTKLVGVLLGNGDGTFQSAVAYDSGGLQAYSVAVADVNGDGKPDLLVANWVASDQDVGSGTVGVLLGNGDGTFQPAVAYDSGGTLAYSIAVADVNGDGNLDVAVANCAPTGSFACPNFGGSGGTGVVGILLGNGDGTFRPVVTYDSGGLYATSIAIADVNGDGKPDLLVTNWCASAGCGTDGVVGVLVGNGDGTFQPAQTFDSGGGAAWSVAVADVNGDGMPDLLVADNSSSSAVGVLLHSNPTTTKLVSSLNPAAYGQSVTFTATVSAASGTPTGTVIFYDGSTAIGSVTLANGSASLSTSSLSEGSHSITAAYQGVGTFVPSTSPPLNQVVNPETTTTSLASSLNPALVNESVTYTAIVTNQYGGAVTGTVVFQDGGSTVATVTVVGNQAAYGTKYSLPGTHSITATYSGDASNTGSISATLMEQINKGFLSKTTLTTSGSPSFVDQPVTFTATVTSTHGTIPDGELVTFLDNTTAIGTSATASGVATFVTSSLAAKTHIIKAAYGGDATFEPSIGSVKQVVNKYTTTTTLNSSLNPSNYGQAVTLTATVTPTGPYQPTGEVTFKNGSATLGIGTLSAGGVAALTTAKIPVGTDSLTATYNGDTWNGKSASAAITQTVSQDSVSMVLTSTPNPSTFRKSVKFTATLTSNGSLPSGQPVTFSYNNATLGTAKVSGKGVATFSTTTLPQGSDVVTAAYAGSADYSSASATVTQVVN